MAFSIKGATDTTYQTPVDDAKPLIEAPPIIHYPTPQGFTGEGKPCAAIGKPWAVVGRNTITSTGLAWWKARVNTTLDATLVCVTLYDPKSVAWGTYQAWLHWPPEYDVAEAADVPKLTKARFKFSAIESTS